MKRTLVTADKATELFPVVDAEGNVIGKMSRALPTIMISMAMCWRCLARNGMVMTGKML